MSKETLIPGFEQEQPGNQDEFGIDNSVPGNETQSKETTHIPFDNAESEIKVHTNAGAVVTEAGAPASETELKPTADVVLETLSTEADEFIEEQVVNSDGVPEDQAHAVLNELLEKIQK